jgi:hypothetical protein
VLDPVGLYRIKSVAVYPAIPSHGVNVNPVLLSQLDSELYSSLDQHTALELRKLTNSATGGAGEAAHARLALAAAIKAKADGVLLLIIDKYVERQGSRAGATAGAEVALRFVLVSTDQRATVWRANYFFHDIALSENLLRLGERLQRSRMLKGWLSADEIALAGIQSAAMELERARAGGGAS